VNPKTDRPTAGRLYVTGPERGCILSTNTDGSDRKVGVTGRGHQGDSVIESLALSGQRLRMRAPAVGTLRIPKESTESLGRDQLSKRCVMRRKR